MYVPLDSFFSCIIKSSHIIIVPVQRPSWGKDLQIAIQWSLNVWQKLSSPNFHSVLLTMHGCIMCFSRIKIKTGFVASIKKLKFKWVKWNWLFIKLTNLFDGTASVFIKTTSLLKAESTWKYDKLFQSTNINFLCLLHVYAMHLIWIYH